MYYVYYHRRDGKIVYIGKGKDGRAWYNKRNHPEHTQWATNCIHNNTWGDHVRIIEGSLSEAEAYQLEKRLIKLLRPAYNDEGQFTICDCCDKEWDTLGSYKRHMFWQSNRESKYKAPSSSFE